MVPARSAPHPKGKTMTKYLLSTYMVDGEVPDAPPSPDEMQAMMEQIIALEADMEASGSLGFRRPTGLSSNFADAKPFRCPVFTTGRND